MLLLNTFRRFTTETYEIAQKMREINVISLCALSLLLASAASSYGQSNTSATTPQAQTPPKTWIDADTGHRVTRLTDEPNSEGLFFNLNAYTPDGRDMIYTSPEAILDLNFATRQTKLIVSGKLHNVVIGTRTRRVFFTREGPAYVYAVNIDSKQVTRLASIPPRGIISSVNADETLLVGTFVEGTAPEFNQFMGKAAQEALAAALKDPTAKRLTKDDIKLRAMKMRLEAKIPEDMFTVNLETGKVNIILKGTDWLNRVQFSPTDPNLIMYAHEGHSTDVDRIWTIRADGSQNQMIHMRGIKEESAAREFWSRDGKTIWYELQKPKGEDFALMGYDVATGNRKLFHMDKMESSMYYNSATDGSFFCGSGRRSESAHGDDPSEGQTLRSREWIEVLHPILNDADSGADPQYANWFHYNNTSSSGAPNAKYTGWFRRERLVNMYKNDYTKFEPNVRVSPDNRLVIFTSNMFGPTYVFGVEVN